MIACDCGAAKAKTTHVSWCSTQQLVIATSTPTVVPKPALYCDVRSSIYSCGCAFPAGHSGDHDYSRRLASASRPTPATVPTSTTQNCNSFLKSLYPDTAIKALVPSYTDVSTKPDPYKTPVQFSGIQAWLPDASSVHYSRATVPEDDYDEDDVDDDDEAPTSGRVLTFIDEAAHWHAADLADSAKCMMSGRRGGKTATMMEYINELVDSGLLSKSEIEELYGNTTGSEVDTEEDVYRRF